jgi:uncharacterized SAM-binding protein YcdF (DUF218 family)
LNEFALKKLVGTLLLPPTGFLLVALLGVLLLCLPRGGRRRRAWQSVTDRPLSQRLGRILAATGVILALAISTWPVAGALANWLEAPYVELDPIGDRLPRGRAADWKLAPATAPQAIVMLTGDAAGDGPGSNRKERLQGDTLERALHTARVAKLTGLPILVSGGVVRPSRSALAEMSRDVIEKDFGVRVRWLETQSRATAENAAFTARILQPAGIRRILLVTHAVHMRRAEELFRRQGFDVVVAPYGFMGKSWRAAWQMFWPSNDALQVSYASCHELLGLLWFWLTGWPSSTAAR